MRKLMWFTIGFVISCALSVWLQFQAWLLYLSVGALLVGVGLCFAKKKLTYIAATVLFGLFAGIIWLHVYDISYLRTARAQDGKTVSATIEISDHSYQTQYGIAAEGKMPLDDSTFRVIVYLNDIEELSPGDAVSGTFKLRFTAEGGEREATYHPGKGILLLAYEDVDITLQKAQFVPAKYFGSGLRRSILDIIDSIFPDDTSGFARALLLGDSSEVTYEEDTAFKTSGIRHVIAVSGLHVSILFALVYTLCGKRRILTAIIGLPALLLFAAVAGFTPSVTRACIMQALMILALLFDKEYDPPTALAFAVLVILANNPLAITSVSLQLSAGCVIGILMFYGRINNYLVRLLRCPKGMSYRSRLTRWFAGSISVTLSAMITSTPLCAYYFGMVSTVGILANLLTLWFVSASFYGIMFACIVGAIWLPAGKIVAWIVSWLMRYVIFVAKALSDIPMSAVYTCSIYVVLWLIVSYVLLVLFMLFKKKRPGVFVAAVLSCLCVAVLLSYIEPRMDTYRVTILDVGQGQAIHLQAGDEHYLVDCGGDQDEKAADVTAEHLLSQGITHLDGLIITHYDRDHAGGVPYLLSRVSADKIYMPAIRDDGEIKNTIVAAHENAIYWVRSEETIRKAWGKISLFPGEKLTDDNENCLCILFQPSNCDILITGDRGVAGERKLLESTHLPELELLVVGHHGSNASTGFALLSQTRPKAAAISVGKNNLHGHPSNELLKRLALFGCKVWRTDINGTIVYKG